ncbi:MAG TPA: DinB family protein [Bryobacteraceae bacterium]|nr:DinB family protein [Bryobacteraceae bacterium]
MDLRSLLIETHAHMPPAEILSDLTENDAARRFPGISHSIADIVAHMAFWQGWFAKRIAGTAEPLVATAAMGWPEVGNAGFSTVREQFLSGLDRLVALVGNPELLGAPVTPALEFPPLATYTVHDALIHVAHHNSHHLGQIVLLRQLYGMWPPSGGSFTW